MNKNVYKTEYPQYDMIAMLRDLCVACIYPINMMILFCGVCFGLFPCMNL